MKSEKNISGGYLIYKPIGMTSRQVDNTIGKLLKTRRVGHIGTLDPMAEGLLPVLVGPATRIAQFVDNGIKGYSVCIRLGIATTTDDAEGEVISSKPVEVQHSDIIEALKSFSGEIEQIPPLYSAKKVSGTPMHKLARKGIKMTLPPKTVLICSIENVRIELPFVNFDMVCGTGTYLRAIARDLGINLGCGGHLHSLVRTRVGSHDIKNAVPLEQIIKSIQAGFWQKYMLTETQMLPHLPKVVVGKWESWQILHGQNISVDVSKLADGQLFILTDENDKLLAIAEKFCEGYRYLRVLR